MAEKFKKSKRGGPRKGAGRPKGAPSKRDLVLQTAAQAVIERCGDTLDPVDAMREVADWAVRMWREQQSMEWAELAVEWQSKIAPYVRPRLAAIEANLNVNISIFERIDRGRERLAIAA